MFGCLTMTYQICVHREISEVGWANIVQIKRKCMSVRWGWVEDAFVELSPNRVYKFVFKKVQNFNKSILDVCEFLEYGRTEGTWILENGHTKHLSTSQTLSLRGWLHPLTWPIPSTQPRQSAGFRPFGIRPDRSDVGAVILPYCNKNEGRPGNVLGSTP